MVSDERLPNFIATLIRISMIILTRISGVMRVHTGCPRAFDNFRKAEITY